MINYIKNELIYKNLLTKSILLIFINYILITLNISYFNSINIRFLNFWDMFYSINNNLISYIIPIVFYYMYFMKDYIADCDFNYTYIYKFKDKYTWIKFKMITILISTILFISINYIIFILIGIINFKFNLGFYKEVILINEPFFNTLINFLLIYIIQIFTLYIYILICLYIILFTYDYISIYLLMAQSTLITLIFFNLIFQNNIILSISLIRFITPINMTIYGHGIIHGIFILSLILFILIKFIRYKLNFYEVYLLNNKI